MRCPNCGAELPDVARFCTKCGTRLTPPEPVQEKPVQQPVQQQPVQQQAVQPEPVQQPVQQQPKPVQQPKRPEPAAAPVKKKKKTWLFVLLGVLAALIVAGAVLCLTGVIDVDKLLHGDKEQTETDADREEGEEGEDAETNAEGGAQAASHVKIGLILLHDENSDADRRFIEGIDAACRGRDAEYVLRTNIPEDQPCYDAAVELIEDEGCNVVIATSFGHEPFLIRAAGEYPDVQFCHISGTKAHTEGLDNYHNAYVAAYEGRYLNGIAAGMKLNEMIENGKITADQAKLGFVGAYPYAEVKSAYTAYYLGAKSVCPSAAMEVLFTNSWYDEAYEREAAGRLIDNGCVIISQYSDSLGAPLACDGAGVPNVAYGDDLSDLYPDTALACSSVNWEPYFSYVIDCMLGGTAIDVDWVGTVADGAVTVGEYAIAEANTSGKIDTARAALADGQLHVFDTSTFTVDGEELTSYMADVDDMGDFQPDTEVVSDGYFHESEFRSAPYFDVDIDGITVVD